MDLVALMNEEVAVCNRDGPLGFAGLAQAGVVHVGSKASP
jgi:hypothetical protein